MPFCLLWTYVSGAADQKQGMYIAKTGHVGHVQHAMATSPPGESARKLLGLACKAWFSLLNANSKTAQHTVSYRSRQMPALFPKLSVDALIPSHPSQRRKQRLVISLVVVLVSDGGSSSCHDVTRFPANNAAEAPWSEESALLTSEILRRLMTSSMIVFFSVR